MLRALAHDRIDFPVPAIPASLDAGRAFGNVPFVSQAAAAIIGVVTLSALLRSLSQVPPEHSASGFVAPDVAVDRFVTQAPLHQPEPANNPDDLFWRPLLAQQSTYDDKVPVAVMSVTPGAPAPGHGFSVRSGESIAQVDAVTLITPKLPRYRAAMSAQGSGDISLAKALL